MPTTACLATLLCAVAAPRGEAQPRGGDQASVRLVSETEAAAPGRTMRVALVFDIKPEWHLYWRNPGDTGVAPIVQLDLPEGVEAGPIQWPAPERYVHGGGRLLDYIHEASLTLVVPLRVGEEVESGSTLTIGADVEWLACREVCIPGWASPTLSIPVSSPDRAPGRADDAPIFDAFDAAAPRPFEAARRREVRLAWESGALSISAPGAAGIEWIPDQPRVGGPEDPIASCEAEGPLLRVPYRASGGDAGRVTGVLKIRGGDAAGAYEVALPPPPTG